MKFFLIIIILSGSNKIIFNKKFRKKKTQNLNNLWHLYYHSYKYFEVLLLEAKNGIEGPESITMWSRGGTRLCLGFHVLCFTTSSKHITTWPNGYGLVPPPILRFIFLCCLKTKGKEDRVEWSVGTHRNLSRKKHQMRSK